MDRVPIKHSYLMSKLRNLLFFDFVRLEYSVGSDQINFECSNEIYKYFFLSVLQKSDRIGSNSILHKNEILITINRQPTK